MKFEETPLQGSFIVNIDCREDSRGWFARTYCKNEFKQIGFTGEWVQLNHSYTKKRGAVRGMHFQKFPFMEIKLIRCISLWISFHKHDNLRIFIQNFAYLTPNLDIFSSYIHIFFELYRR